ncbi:hypothetical protein M9H77_19506 [Catharanthus roseus]|uniref:Uncharacterized protein n=1 Tax=Catharanthus roseus TaxID=4058 RepID=A0ACC0BAT6_CATRO|nr:hypothetical protein M9H77_19506 [Catharanthus roseus]
MSKEVEVQSPLIFYAKILINDGWKLSSPLSGTPFPGQPIPSLVILNSPSFGCYRCQAILLTGTVFQGPKLEDVLGSVDSFKAGRAKRPISALAVRASFLRRCPGFSPPFVEYPSHSSLSTYKEALNLARWAKNNFVSGYLSLTQIFHAILYDRGGTSSVSHNQFANSVFYDVEVNY